MLNEELSDSLLAILFASPEPVTLPQLIEVFPDVAPSELIAALHALAEDFGNRVKAVELRAVAEG